MEKQQEEENDIMYNGPDKQLFELHRDGRTAQGSSSSTARGTARSGAGTLGSGSGRERPRGLRQDSRVSALCVLSLTCFTAYFTLE